MPRRRRGSGRLRPGPPPFSMADHDEMTGTSAWEAWETRSAIADAISTALRPGDVLLGSAGLAGLSVTPARPDEPAGVLRHAVVQIACAVCGARGIPLYYGRCPSCGRGSGWAQLERVPGLALHPLRGRW